MRASLGRIGLASGRSGRWGRFGGGCSVLDVDSGRSTPPGFCVPSLLLSSSCLISPVGIRADEGVEDPEIRAPCWIAAGTAVASTALSGCTLGAFAFSESSCLISILDMSVELAAAGATAVFCVSPTSLSTVLVLVPGS